MSLKDEMDKLMKEFLKIGGKQDPEKWPQVGKISIEDVARRRALFAKADERQRESDACEARMEALKAAVNADSKEWWAYVYKQYGLPSGDYTIMDDGRIMQRPKEEVNP